jgi:hypothetical protein
MTMAHTNRIALAAGAVAAALAIRRTHTTTT